MPSLVAVNERYGEMRRLLDADQAQLAAEIARRSSPDLGPDSLAKSQGFRNPTALIAATNGTTNGEAARLVQVGEATTPRRLLSGESAPARHPHVAAAMAAGADRRVAAAAIIACSTGSRCAPGQRRSTPRRRPSPNKRPDSPWTSCPGC